MPCDDDDDIDESQEPPAVAGSHVQDMHRILANRDRRTRQNREPSQANVRELVVNSCSEGTDYIYDTDNVNEKTPLLSGTDSLCC